MKKASMVQARIETGLKKKADAILKKVGISSSQAINAMYAQIVLRKGLPFELRLPNKQTLQAMQELEKGDGKTFKNFKEMMDDLEDYST